MIEKVIKELQKIERGYTQNAKKDKVELMREFWRGCANGVGYAIEIIRKIHAQEGEP